MSRAVFLHGIRDVRVEPYQSRRPRPGEVMVEVEAVGICGSDLHYYKDGRIGSGQVIAAPFVPGHEFAGRLLDDCEERGLAAGTLVAVDPASPCHACEWCARGHHNLCPRTVFIGAPPHDGAMTEALPVPAASLVALPDGMTALQAAMCEPLGVSIHAFDLARPRLMETVAVVGCGCIGLGVIQLLRQAPVARVLAVDPQPHRAALAERFGAAVTGPDIAAVIEATGGRGADLVIEATNAPEGFADAVGAAAIGGRLVLVGIPDGDGYRLSASEARRRGLTVRFSRRMGEVYPRAIALVMSGRVDVDAIVSHRVGLDEVPDAFAAQAAAAAGLVKTVVFPARRA